MNTHTPPAAPAAPAAAPAAPAAPAPKAAKEKPVKVKVERERKNGQTRPAADSVTGKLWATFDAISKKSKAPATRKEILEAAKLEGINASTAATQYSRWRAFHGHVGTAAPGRLAKAAAPAVKVEGAPPAPAAPVVPA